MQAQAVKEICARERRRLLHPSGIELALARARIEENQRRFNRVNETPAQGIHRNTLRDRLRRKTLQCARFMIGSCSGLCTVQASVRDRSDLSQADNTGACSLSRYISLARVNICALESLTWHTGSARKMRKLQLHHQITWSPSKTLDVHNIENWSSKIRFLYYVQLTRKKKWVQEQGPAQERDSKWIDGRAN